MEEERANEMEVAAQKNEKGEKEKVEEVVLTLFSADY